MTAFTTRLLLTACLLFRDSRAGTSLKWKAVLGAGAKLAEVIVKYTDSSGVVGGFGAPELSGFKYRKSFKLSGSSVANLFNYQTKITLGESSAVKGADISCDGHILADFNDVRFALADGETPLPFTLEKISGAKPNRSAEFFVKVPQIPSSGLLLYVYYGNPVAANLSSPSTTFDFYENFTAGASTLDKDKWVTHISPGGSSSLSKNGFLLDAASVMTKDFQFKGGIIEVAAVARTGFETRLIIRDSSPDVETDAGQVAYSSAYKDAEHCIAIGKIVKANVANPSAKDTLYDYRVSVDGENNITFDRYSDGFAEKQATITYQDQGGLVSGYLGLKTAGPGLGNSQTLYSWIRVRKYAVVLPLVDSGAVGKEEAVVMPLFVNVILAPNGDLTLSDPKIEGTYLTRPVSSEYDIRIIVPRWKGAGVQVDISADGGKTYKKNCTKESYYYAARNDFGKGNSLCSRLVLKPGAASSVSSLEFVALQYALGSVVVLAPNGSETLTQGTTAEIKWTAWDYDATYPMKLEYSLDGGKTFKIITANAANSGSYLWQIPLTPDLSSTNAVVRVSDSYDALMGDSSDRPFTIVAGQAAQVQAPTTVAPTPSEEAVKPAEENVPAEEVKAPAITPKKAGVSAPAPSAAGFGGFGAVSVDVYNAQTHPEDFYLKASDVPKGALASLVKVKGKMWVAYIFQEITPNRYEISIRSKKGVQKYVFTENGVSLLEDEGQGFQEKVKNSWFFVQGQKGNGPWQDIPSESGILSYKQNPDNTLTITNISNIGKLTAQIGFDGNNYHHKFSFGANTFELGYQKLRAHWDNVFHSDQAITQDDTNVQEYRLKHVKRFFFFDGTAKVAAPTVPAERMRPALVSLLRSLSS